MKHYKNSKMSYKLINLKTKEETICDKVVIDGIVYYCSIKEMDIEQDELCFEIYHEYDSNKIRFSDNNNPNMSWYLRKLNMSYRKIPPKEFEFYRIYNNTCKKIIATNNQNIDIPKVIDEVERLAKEHCEYWEFNKVLGSGNNGLAYDSYIYGYNESQKTHPFSLEDMIEFGKYAHNDALSPSNIKTFEELFQTWKEQQLEVIYYE